MQLPDATMTPLFPPAQPALLIADRWQPAQLLGGQPLQSRGRLATTRAARDAGRRFWILRLPQPAGAPLPAAGTYLYWTGKACRTLLLERPVGECWVCTFQAVQATTEPATGLHWRP